MSGNRPGAAPRRVIQMVGTRIARMLEDHVNVSALVDFGLRRIEAAWQEQVIGPRPCGTMIPRLDVTHDARAGFPHLRPDEVKCAGSI